MNTRPTIAVLVAVAMTVLLAVRDAAAADVIVKRDAVVSGQTVTLGDVASVVNATPVQFDALTRVVLAPAPMRRTIISTAVIRDRLTAGGLFDADLNLVGSTRCEVLFKADTARPVERVFVSRVDRDRAAAVLAEAVEKRIETALPTYGPVDVTVELADDAVSTVTAYQGPLQLRGGTADLAMPQSLELLSNPPVKFIAHVRRIDRVAVASVPIRRGEIIQAAHVRFQPRDERGIKDSHLVIGQEAQRDIPAGRTLQARDLKKVTLVRSNAIVTVSVTMPGITVRRQMKSRSTGGLGDTITCVSLDGLQTVAAIVSGPNVAEIPSAPQVIQTSGQSDRDDRVRFAVGEADARRRAAR